MEESYHEKYLEQRFKDLTTLMNARFDVVDGDNDEINDHLKGLNGTVKEHEKEITNLKISDALHIASCPTRQQIDEFGNDFKKLKVEAITTWIKKHWKLFILATAVLLYMTYSIFSYFSIEQIINWIK